MYLIPMIKEIQGYNGYQVISNGDIIGIFGKKLKPILNVNGYITYGLFNKGKQKRFLAHRIIAKCFIPNPKNKPQVNHINGVKTDNRVENLEWCTGSENQKHAVNIGLRDKGYKSMAKKNSKPVIDLSTGIFYNSSKEAAMLLRIDKDKMSRMLIGKIKNNTQLKYC